MSIKESGVAIGKAVNRPAVSHRDTLTDRIHPTVHQVNRPQPPHTPKPLLYPSPSTDLPPKKDQHLIAGTCSELGRKILHLFQITIAVRSVHKSTSYRSKDDRSAAAQGFVQPSLPACHHWCAQMIPDRTIRSKRNRLLIAAVLKQLLRRYLIIKV